MKAEEDYTEWGRERMGLRQNAFVSEFAAVSQ
jgi:hypothetical protein